MKRMFFALTGMMFIWLSCQKSVVKTPITTENPPGLTETVPVESPVEKGESLIMSGIYFLENGKVDSALNRWKKALNYLPEDGELLNWIGVGYHKKNMSDSAEYYYKRAIESDPNQYQAYNNLGYSQFLKTDYSHALTNFEKSLAINPYYDQARLNYETTKKILQGRLTFKAMELFEKAASEDSLEVKLHYYKNAVSLQPDYVEAYNNMGVTFYYRGSVDSAIIYLNKAIKMKPNYPEANNNLGFILSQLGLEEKAIPFYLTALNAKTNYLVAMLNLCDSYIRLKKYINAQKVIQTAKELAPDNALVRKKMKLVEYLMNREKGD